MEKIIEILSLFVTKHKWLIITYIVLVFIFVPMNILLLPKLFTSIVNNAPKPVSFPYQTFISSIVVLCILNVIISRLNTQLYNSFTQFYHTYLIKQKYNRNESLSDDEIEELLSVPVCVKDILDFTLYNVIPLVITSCIAIYYLYIIDYILPTCIMVCGYMYICVILKPKIKEYHKDRIYENVYQIQMRKKLIQEISQPNQQKQPAALDDDISMLSRINTKQSSSRASCNLVSNSLVFSVITICIIILYYKFDMNLITKRQVYLASLFQVLTLRLYIAFAREMTDMSTNVEQLRRMDKLLQSFE